MDPAVLNIDGLLVGLLLVVVVVVAVVAVVVVVVFLLLLLLLLVVVVVDDDDLQSRTVSFQRVVVWYVSIWCPGINGQILEIVGG